MATVGGSSVTDTIDSYARLWYRSSWIVYYPHLLIDALISVNSQAFNHTTQSGVAAQERLGGGGVKDTGLAHTRSGNARHGQERPDESLSRMEPCFRMPHGYRVPVVAGSRTPHSLDAKGQVSKCIKDVGKRGSLLATRSRW